MYILSLFRNKVIELACTTSLGNSFHNNAYKEGLLIAVANGSFYIKFAVTIDSSSTILIEFEKVLKWTFI